MKRIGVRELRQDASQWLRRVRAGESFEVTDRGRPVALLIPVPGQTGLDALIASGRARPAAGSLRLPSARISVPAGAPTPSEALTELRRDER